MIFFQWNQCCKSNFIPGWRGEEGGGSVGVLQRCRGRKQDRKRFRRVASQCWLVHFSFSWDGLKLRFLFNTKSLKNMIFQLELVFPSLFWDSQASTGATGSPCTWQNMHNIWSSSMLAIKWNPASYLSCFSAYTPFFGLTFFTKIHVELKPEYKLWKKGVCKYMTQGKIDLRNESGRPMKVKVVGEVSEKWN